MWKAALASAIFLLGTVLGQDECPCELVPLESSTYRWNCAERNLTRVPGLDCWGKTRETVTELWLTQNNITEIRSIDFLGLTDLRVLRVDHNMLEFFDPTAMIDMTKLEIFHVDYENEEDDDSSLDMHQLTLSNKPNLVEAIFINSNVEDLPLLTSSPLLQKVDARSSNLLTLPRPLFSSSLPETSESFLFTITDNDIYDIACDILLPIPAGATINVDGKVTLWCQNRDEKDQILAKGWKGNRDVKVFTKICEEQGDPYVDPSMCEPLPHK